MVPIQFQLNVTETSFQNDGFHDDGLVSGTLVMSGINTEEVTGSEGDGRSTGTSQS